MVLLMLSGVGYRMAAARYERAFSSVPIPAGTLARLPLRIDEWEGCDIPLDERVIKATDTDDHLNRTYSRPGEGQVSLFIGYGVHLRDLMPHRPEVCYRGAGWTLDGTRENERVKLSDGNPLACQIHHFRRGGLGTDQISVLNYYLVDGEYCSDVSLLRSRARRINRNGTYAAQVQISCAVDGTGGNMPLMKADELVKDFAAASADQIEKLLEDAVQRANSE